MKKALIILSLMLSVLVAQAQMTGEPRAFSGGLVDSLRQIEAYQYGIAPEKFSPTPSQRENNPTEEKQKTGQAIQWLIYLLVAGILLVVAFVVIRQFSGTTGKALDRISGLQIESTEDLTYSDFQTLAIAAEATQDWRLAFRYRYLWVLQQLQTNNQIVWHPYKTDSDYLQEIKSHGLKTAYEPLMKAYSFIWYGQKEINQTQYHRLIATLSSFS